MQTENLTTTFLLTMSWGVDLFNWLISHFHSDYNYVTMLCLCIRKKETRVYSFPTCTNLLFSPCFPALEIAAFFQGYLLFSPQSPPVTFSPALLIFCTLDFASYITDKMKLHFPATEESAWICTHFCFCLFLYNEGSDSRKGLVLYILLDSFPS